MKKILFLPALALALTTASCTSTTEETTTVDTMMMSPDPGAETNTLSTDANGTTPPDNTNGGISTGPSDASMEGTGVGTGIGAGRAGSNASGVNSAGSRSGTSVNTSSRAGAMDDGHVPPGNAGPHSNTTRPESSYPEAQPGAPVDGRMPRGTSR